MNKVVNKKIILIATTLGIAICSLGLLTNTFVHLLLVGSENFDILRIATITAEGVAIMCVIFCLLFLVVGTLTAIVALCDYIDRKFFDIDAKEMREWVFSAMLCRPVCRGCNHTASRSRSNNSVYER